MNPSEELPPRSRIDRRVAIKWMLTAAGSLALLERHAPAAVAGGPLDLVAGGYGPDPDLLKIYKPGDVWPLTFTAQQRRSAAALCDLIIPADAKSPSAGSLGVHDFIDEWISAPYPGHERDRGLVLGTLQWLETESQSRYSQPFTNTVVSQKRTLCDEICFTPKAKPELRAIAQGFSRFRDLTGGGFYTTPEGMKDIGYVGNVATVTFEGPPPEALKRLGLA